MAKRKKTRARRPTPSRQTDTQSYTLAATSTPVRGGLSPTSSVDLASEYSYVITDLRRIAAIALAMFGLLFVLAFIIK